MAKAPKRLKAQTRRSAAGYIAAQIVGGIAGAVLANAMFELPLVTWSMTARARGAQLLSEAVATFGLLGVVIAVGRTRAAIFRAVASSRAATLASRTTQASSSHAARPDQP